jgi:transcriptional regulator with XRE-family HTH domain
MTTTTRARQMRLTHYPTAIGEMLRSYRIRETIVQKDMAQLLGVNASRLCKYELGDQLPDADTLAKFSSLSGVPLASLEALLSQPRLDIQPAPHGARNGSLALPPPAAPEPAPAGLEAFIDALDRLVIMPRDRDDRRRWFELARQLFELSGKEQST